MQVTKAPYHLPLYYLLEKDKLALLSKLSSSQRPGKPYFTGRRETYIYKLGQNSIYAKHQKG